MVMPIGNEAKTTIIPWVTYGLIAINLACFGLELTLPASFTVAYAVTPYEITHDVDIHEPFHYQWEHSQDSSAEHPDQPSGFTVHQAAGPRPIWLTLFSALFLHADTIHLAGNMLFLYIFAQKIEEALGAATYLGFYLGCGLVGTLSQILVSPESLTPILGASGAIAGVMGGYLVWFPRDRVRVLFFNVLFLIPAYAVIGCWILIQLVTSELVAGTDTPAAKIAYLSHMTGALAGILFGAMLWFRQPSSA